MNGAGRSGLTSNFDLDLTPNALEDPKKLMLGHEHVLLLLLGEDRSQIREAHRRIAALEFGDEDVRRVDLSARGSCRACRCNPPVATDRRMKDGQR